MPQTATPQTAQPARAPYHNSATLPLGIAFGAAAGVILGGVTGTWGVWFPICIGVGTALGLALSEAGRPKAP